jgi:choline kinase
LSLGNNPNNPRLKLSHLRDLPAEAVVILLGAGRPYRGTPPSALQETSDERRVLDWIMDAFSALSVEWHFVGGYHLQDVAKSYPNMSYSLNADWQSTGSVSSLFVAPLGTDRPHYIAYTDIVFNADVVTQLSVSDADVALAVDRTWRRRYERRRIEEISKAEKVRLNANAVLDVGSHLDPNTADAEFAGLVKLSPRAMKRVLSLRDEASHRFERASLPDLLNDMVREGLDCQGIEVAGAWAELNAPQDLARFVLGTKAETLERLRPLVRHSEVGDQVAFTVRAWRDDSEGLLANIRTKFGGNEVVVRSSSLAEDSWTASNAGTFLSLTHVPVDDDQRLRSGIDDVILSFDSEHLDNQVLVQAMLTDLRVSGVVFTRSLSCGAPYYVVNYDDKTGSAASVTDGTGRHLQTLIMHRETKQLPNEANPILFHLLRSLKELEILVGHDSLDVEFAIGRDSTVHILQVRPIAVDHSKWRVSDKLVNRMLAGAERDFRDRQTRRSFEVGARTAFGVMPDWNPAEIIGNKPRRLATSLYRWLITDEIWATQRAEFGYRDVRPHPLMHCFLGHPYIDVRASFSSFIPAALSDVLAERLVNSYLDRLESNPQLHDKVEFEIVFTCLTLDFEQQAERLLEAGFSADEVFELHSALTTVTRQALERWQDDLDQIAILERRFANLARLPSMPLARACALLEDCRRYGTLPFAHLARGAFVATALLRSAVCRSILTQAELSAFMASLNTVARRFADDGARVASGKLEWDTYVETYGHLRPGTYEITSPCYAEDPEHYLRPMVSIGDEASSEFSWEPATAAKLTQGLRDAGVLAADEDLNRFTRFCRATIEGREYAKFAFTRNLSAALEAIAAFGEGQGLTRAQLSHLGCEELFAINSGMAPADLTDWLQSRVEEGMQWHNLAQAIELPPLLLRSDDMSAFLYPQSQPNFVSLGSATGEVVDLAEATEGVPDLRDKIALIPQADPGFDWLFGQKVAGLVTMYGGANSHMAIRAAEFELPAAIGVGESLYAQYRHARILQIDCSRRHIQVLK